MRIAGGEAPALLSLRPRLPPVLRAMLAAARSAGAARLDLGTRLVLTGNRLLFASCGFVEFARHAHPGYAAPTWVEMEKRLEPAGPLG